jgi:transposase InsO family protein
VYEQIRHVDGQQGELTIERMCILAAVSRAGYYRVGAPGAEAGEEKSRPRDAIQRVAIESRQYGYRPVTHALRAQGWEVNHKRIARLMREDGLLAIRKRRFVPQTTDSRHDFEVAINVARRLIPTAMNQLWVADITYVRLGRADVFLAVVLDAFSRKVVRLESGAEDDDRAPACGTDERHRFQKACARADSPFRSRSPICVRGLCRHAARAWHDPEHEQAGQSLR